MKSKLRSFKEELPVQNRRIIIYDTKKDRYLAGAIDYKCELNISERPYYLPSFDNLLWLYPTDIPAFDKRGNDNHRKIARKRSDLFKAFYFPLLVDNEHYRERLEYRTIRL